MTTNTVPLEHLQEATKLTADAVVDLFELTLSGTVSTVITRFKDGKTATWQGNLYENLACNITGVSRHSTEEKTRPTLTILNPLGIFTATAFSGYLDGAKLIRRRVLRTHLENNINISEAQYWIVSRPSNIVSGQSCSLELRSAADGPDSFLPARRYMPPDFPFVKL